MILSCFDHWPKVLNNQTLSSNSVNIFNITVHTFCNLFWKIWPLFGQVLIACLKCSRASFLTSSYSKKMRWGQDCRTDTFWEILICLFFKSLLPDLMNFHELWRSSLFACFDIEFVQSGVITITKNKFFWMIAVA